MDRDKSQLKVSVEWRRRVRSWNERERRIMVVLSGEKSQEEGGWRGSSEWLLCSRFSHNFLFLECHSGRGTSQKRHMWELRVDESFASVQKRSDSLEGPQKVEAIERSILWRRYNLERKYWGERTLVRSKITVRNF